ncbi:MAG: ComEC/Rec2 family competence protein [Patescibacteria group bacterium]
MFEKVINSKSKTFLAFCFCFLAGVAIASLLNIKINFVYLYLFLFISAALLIITWQNKKTRFIAIGVIIAALGFARYVFAFPTDSPNNISSFAGKQKIIGYVSAEPDVRTDGVRYIVESEGVKGGGGRVEEKKLNGRVYVKSGLYPRYDYGDKLELECELERPEPIEDFRYDMYLARYGVFSICQNPKVGKVGEGEGSGLMRGILSLKNIAAEKINKLWHEPYASFMAGLLYGYRGGLGSLNDLFARTGVTHIVAISGYNISIIAAILIAICVNLLIPRKKAFWIIILGIALFVLFAGASASVVRAGIMGVIVLLAKQIGRTSRVGNVMALTCVLMALQNPFILIWDAGFQLSFISTLGLVYVSPFIGVWFQKVPEFLGLKESLISTLSAITATLPLILYQFGRLSIVAPAVNVLILWTIPLLMTLGFFAVLSSFVFNPLAQVIAWIAWVGLSYVILVVKWFAGLSFASVDFTIPWWLMISGYVVMVFAFRKVNRTRI